MFQRYTDGEWMDVKEDEVYHALSGTYKRPAEVMHAMKKDGITARSVATSYRYVPAPGPPGCPPRRLPAGG